MAIDALLTPVERRCAWDRYSAKKWYERIVLQPKILLDLPQLTPQDAAEVASLRLVVGIHPPWKE